jgi:hypothetical protein
MITKEMPVTKEVIEKLPSSVLLICEAGTGLWSPPNTMYI